MSLQRDSYAVVMAKALYLSLLLHTDSFFLPVQKQTLYILPAVYAKPELIVNGTFKIAEDSAMQ